MLTESFVSSVLGSEKSPNSSATKDAGIYHYEYQPLPGLKSSYKKSSAGTNCLAVSASHIFAAQADKAVVHVYNRDRGNQEALVPFPEKLRSLALIGSQDGAGILALGTEGGRLILWESTTCLVADPTSNFLLSGSPDSNIHIWSLPALLSFSSSVGNGCGQLSPFSPVRTLSNHRAEITALVVGHSSNSTNIAISGSRDNTCIVWDYQNGTLLHTFLLPATPLCLAIDPADRAFYAGYEDGSIKLVDFYKQASMSHPIYDPALQATPTQPPPSDRWVLPAEAASAALCLDVSYDGTTLLSGHQSGKIQIWDIAKGRYTSHLVDFGAPITNLYMLTPSGFLITHKPNLKVKNIVKPRYESSLNSNNLHSSNDSVVPESYSFTAQFASTLPLPRFSSRDLLADFDFALTHPSFPTALLEEGIAELAALSSPSSITSSALATANEEKDLEIANLRAQLSQARIAQQVYTDKALDLNAELLKRDGLAKAREKAKRRRRTRKFHEEEIRRKKAMGEDLGGRNVAMVGIEGSEEEDEEEGLSSSTNEMTESD
ncbi:MAG: hypothetical protein Q9187_003300 [Circinaria calcarea]